MKPPHHNHPETQNLAKESFNAQKTKDKPSYQDLEDRVKELDKIIQVLWGSIKRKNETIETISNALMEVRSR